MTKRFPFLNLRITTLEEHFRGYACYYKSVLKVCYVRLKNTSAVRIFMNAGAQRR